MHRADTGFTTLISYFGGEIDLVMGRPNARTELHHQISRRRSKALPHLRDRARNDAKFGSFLAGMHQAKTATNGIDQIYRAAVRDVNSQADAGLIRDQPVTIRETVIGCNRFTDNGDLIAVNLLRGEERSAIHFSRAAIASSGSFPSGGICRSTSV